jgi:hypothetical protein
MISFQKFISTVAVIEAAGEAYIEYSVETDGKYFIHLAQ